MDGCQAQEKFYLLILNQPAQQRQRSSLLDGEIVVSISQQAQSFRNGDRIVARMLWSPLK